MCIHNVWSGFQEATQLHCTSAHLTYATYNITYTNRYNLDGTYVVQWLEDSTETLVAASDVRPRAATSNPISSLFGNRL